MTSIADPEPEPSLVPEPEAEYTRSVPYDVCVELERSELPCTVLEGQEPFQEVCEGTAGALEPGPAPELHVLRVACAYGEELWTEERAIVLLREHEGHLTMVWSGREIHQVDRGSCVYAEITSFEENEDTVVIRTTTTVTKANENDAACEARRSVASERVTW